MTGAKLKYRHLGRDSAHRISLLRNLVTSLIEHEHIVTTYPKAKEAQREAEKCITLAKRGTDVARKCAMSRIFRPEDILPKLFGPLAQRYSERSGGYTRVLRIEPKDKYDQAPSAVLELVDGQHEIKFAMVARTIARCAQEGKTLSAITVDNIKKLTKFRPDGEAKLLELVQKFKDSEEEGVYGVGGREMRARVLLEGGKKGKDKESQEEKKKKEKGSGYGHRGGRR